jgi:hypothetical protein
MTPTLYAPEAGMPKRQMQSQQKDDDYDTNGNDGNWLQVPEAPYCSPDYAHANSDNSTSFSGIHNRKPPPRG